MKTSDFINKWDDLREQKGFMQRVDPLHPLNFFIRINEKGYDQLVLFSKAEPSQIRSSKALEVEINKRKDGQWATQISSVEKSNQDIFARLCVDLVETSASAKNEKDGMSKVAVRFLAWQKLFAKAHELLPKSVLKGMIGELTFAKFLIEKGLSKDEVITAWVGPDGADRDYVFNNTWFEIKAISTGKDKVTISSLNQLETNINGHLIVMFVDESSKTDGTAISVAEYVRESKKRLEDAPYAYRRFEEKLISLGYIDKNAYEDIFFTVGEMKYYLVNETFPRLVTKSVPNEIVGASYDLSLAGIDHWNVKELALWN